MSTIKNLQAFYSGNLQAFIVLGRPEENREVALFLSANIVISIKAMNCLSALLINIKSPKYAIIQFVRMVVYNI